MSQARDASVVVIGGGIAGIAAALSLARKGVAVTLVEKEAGIGGKALYFACKASEMCNKCSVCLVDQKIKQIEETPALEILTLSKVTQVKSEQDCFKLEIATEPRSVQEDKCIGCGLCNQVCPLEKKAVYFYHPQSVPHVTFVDRALCQNFNGTSCDTCVQTCPSQAIDLQASARTSTITADAIIVTTGFAPFDAARRSQYGYGRLSNVVTGMDLERMLRLQGSLQRPSDGQPPRKVAFIQCVGSRDPVSGQPYCSRVCCMYALRSTKMLKSRFPELALTVFYMDFQSFGKDFGTFVAQCAQQAQLIRAMPGALSQDANGSVWISYEEPGTGAYQKQNFDLVVLSVGITPGEDTPKLAQMLGIDRNTYGFLGSLEDNVQTNRPGVFVAGTCQGPKDIPGSIAQAEQAAFLASAYLEQRQAQQS